MRVVVAMSGGVDSSVAAALLHEEGHEVIGISLKLWEQESEQLHGCCTPDDLRDAKRVASTCGFPHYVFDLVEEFERSVVDGFVTEYLAGRTPNPCVSCNNTVKFKTLLSRARALGAEKLATGHYARLEPDEGDRLRLLQGRDAAKDQSYFLYGLDPDVMSHLLFPIGHLTKDEVRAHAHRLELAVADKPDSQEICFVPKGEHGSFVANHASEGELRPGRILDAEGVTVGTHQGIHQFTVGQRRGLGVATGQRMYVSRIDSEAGDIHVGQRSSLETGGLRTGPCNWFAGKPPTTGTRLHVRIRHRHQGVPCTISPVGAGCDVQFLSPVFGVAPGQAAVFFDGEECLGGGTIREPLP